MGDLPKAGVLMHGTEATVFACARQAEQAVRRSWRYARRKGYDWAQDRPVEWQIWQLAGPPS